MHDLVAGSAAEVRLASDERVVRTGVVSGDGTRVALVVEGGRVELRDAVSGRLVIAFTATVSLGDEVAMALDRDGSRIAFQSQAFNPGIRAV